MNELDAFEEFLVQRDVICVLGENRTHLLRNLFHLIQEQPSLNKASRIRHDSLLADWSEIRIDVFR